MQFPASSTEYVFIPVRGPAGVDLTTFAVNVAIVPEVQGEPGSGDWKAATWHTALNGDTEARLLVTAGQYAAGGYMAYVQVTATPEVPVMKSGRIRVGDP